MDKKIKVRKGIEICSFFSSFFSSRFIWLVCCCCCSRLCAAFKIYRVRTCLRFSARKTLFVYYTKLNQSRSILQAGGQRVSAGFVIHCKMFRDFFFLARLFLVLKNWWVYVEKGFWVGVKKSFVMFSSSFPSPLLVQGRVELNLVEHKFCGKGGIHSCQLTAQ